MKKSTGVCVRLVESDLGRAPIQRKSERVFTQDCWVVGGQVGRGGRENERKVLAVLPLLTPWRGPRGIYMFISRSCECSLHLSVYSLWTGPHKPVLYKAAGQVSILQLFLCLEEE